MSSSASHSALASLTATYTDSEEEDEIANREIREVESNNSKVHIIERSSATNSPEGSNSHDSVTGDESSKSDGGGSGGKRQPTSSSLGLVSYGDEDLIDDEAVDDHYTSDSNPVTEMEDVTESGARGLLKDGSDGESNAEDDSINGTKKKSRIPPEPIGKCAPELQERINKLYEKKIKGKLDMNQAIQRNKNFRNPSIYEKLIKYCDIDELGSNYPKDVFDPHEFHESSFYDELAKAQKAEMERREKERKDRTKVEFVSGTVKKSSLAPPAAEPDNKRKSKWDQRGVMPPLLMTLAPPSQAPLVPPSFTNSASGTKSTVISAFGSIGNVNKKGK